MDTHTSSTITPGKRTHKAPVTRLAYPVPEFSHLTGISTNHAYTLMKLGLLRFVVIGTERRIPHAELVRAVEQGIPIPPEIQAELHAKNKAYRAELEARRATGEVRAKRKNKPLP